MSSDLSINYICRFHSINELKFWVNNLIYFYFIRAASGFTIDGDKFKIELEYSSLDEVKEILDIFSINFKEEAKEMGIVNIADIENIDKTRIINEFPEIQYNYLNKNQELGKYVDFRNGKCRIEIFNSGENFDTVFQSHFEQCMIYESKLKQSKLKILRTLERNSHCVSKKIYPDLFSN